MTPLRKTTAVATSTPLSKAMRAATWLAPIMKAISSSVAKAARDSAGRVVEDMRKRSLCGQSQEKTRSSLR
ncbi:hypothetical protein Y695_02454 [Hydrogenophaga sp. T4]|nr:hypothetical protein Y695_02454 [Hydrogenophaga sp. T4]